jgi:SAM-dependent methyltransferase
VGEELRVVGWCRHADGVRLDVEITPSGPLAQPPWGEAEVRVGTHVLDWRGRMRHWDGPRSAPCTLRWLTVRPVLRTVALPAGLLPRVGTIQVDLVIEGTGWGSSFGLVPLDVRLPVRTLAARRPRDASGLEPWPESLPALRTRLGATRPDGASPTEMAGYVASDAARFVLTVRLALASRPRRLLEIGSNPFFVTQLLLEQAPDLELRSTNWFGAPGPGSQTVVDADGRALHRFDFELVDVEAQPLPYGDGEFDTALFGEVLEHFVADPVRAVSELHRVLRPGGTLVLTTPNVARAENVRRTAEGTGLYDPYSAHGPHGRHNREYAAEELFELLVGNGFRIERHLTRPVHGVHDLDAAWWAATDDDGRGDYHFLVATRIDQPAAPHRPTWLYR